jgi:cytidine deaminase
MTMSQDLFEAARAAMAFAHAPYSKFPVGAAIRAEDGKIYAGANIENLSFPQGWCAEPTAISHMIMGGAKKIVEMAVIAEKLPLCPPCGGCRQKIAEFADAGTPIYLCDETGVKKTVRMADLLPHSFETDLLG